MQGAFRLHEAHIEALGAEYVEVVNRESMASVDALILPGGESGVMLKLLDQLGLVDDLAQTLRSKPVWGICAGAILMAETVTNPVQRSFGAIAVQVERNAYGRQRESTEALVDGYLVSYIRAPRIATVGPSAQVKAWRDNDPVWVEAGRLMVTTFHPETNPSVPSPWHRRIAALA